MGVNLDPGNADCTSGLSQRIYDQIMSDSRNGFSNPLTPDQINNIKAQCYAEAKGVADAINASGGLSGNQPTINGNTMTVTCLSTDVVGDLVVLSGSRTVRKIDVTSGLPAIGVIISKQSTTTATVQVNGTVDNVYVGLTIGDKYFVGSDGRPTNLNPIPGVSSGTEYYLQIIGVAVDSSSLLFMPNAALTALQAP